MFSGVGREQLEKEQFGGIPTAICVVAGSQFPDRAYPGAHTQINETTVQIQTAAPDDTYK